MLGISISIDKKGIKLKANLLLQLRRPEQRHYTPSISPKARPGRVLIAIARAFFESGPKTSHGVGLGSSRGAAEVRDEDEQVRTEVHAEGQ